MFRAIRFSIAIVALCAVAPAQAADLGTSKRQLQMSTRGYSASGIRAATVVVYDYSPGVGVRAYWRKPWRNRHYFPTTGERPEIGRNEDLSAPREQYEPAQTFYRSWTTSSALIDEDADDPFARGRPGQNDLPPLARDDNEPPQRQPRAVAPNGGTSPTVKP